MPLPLIYVLRIQTLASLRDSLFNFECLVKHLVEASLPEYTQVHLLEQSILVLGCPPLASVAVASLVPGIR